MESFGEILTHYAQTFGDLDLLNHPATWKIANPKFDIEQGLKYYLGNRAIWLPEYDEICNWLEDTRGQGLMCIGNCGRGKSLVCSKILPIVLYKHFSLVSKRYSMQDLSNNLDEALQQRFIILDDVGTEEMRVKYGEKRTPFAEIVDQAERKGNTMVITSNLTTQDFQAKYGERVVDRLRELTKLVAFQGKSLRGK